VRAGLADQRHVAAELDKAAAGADTADASVALRMVLMCWRRSNAGQREIPPLPAAVDGISSVVTNRCFCRPSA